MERMVFIVVTALLAIGDGAEVPLAGPRTGRAVVVGPGGAQVSEDPNYDPHPQYAFSYDVQDAITGDSKSQQETRDGDVVQGSYTLIEADGSRRTVEYTADPVNGFNAVVHKTDGAAPPPPVAAPVVKAVARPPLAQATSFPTYATAASAPIITAVPRPGDDSDSDDSKSAVSVKPAVVVKPTVVPASYAIGSHLAAPYDYVAHPGYGYASHPSYGYVSHPGYGYLSHTGHAVVAQPAYHYAAPAVHYTAPAVHYTAPAVHYAAPAVHYTSPTYRYGTPAIASVATPHTHYVY